MALTQRANEELCKLTPEFGVGTYKYNIKFPCEGLFICDKSTGVKTPVHHMIAMIDFEIRDDNVPFQHFKYSDKATGTDIANVSVAKGTVGDKALNFVFHAEPDGRVSVSLFADEEKKQSRCNAGRLALLIPNTAKIMEAGCDSRN
jgi:hypothetical protein